MISQQSENHDVVILGGGPAGSTCAALLRKYRPQLSVFVAEKAVFPRDHVGESQLPGCAQICAEMGCWEKVEAAGFPVKIGASYTWGKTDEVWDFNFIPPAMFPQEEERPARFDGARRFTAFQVDRAKYDKILLDHAEEIGAAVVQGCGAAEIHADGDRITGVTLDDGRRVEGRYYVDASGAAAVIRKAMGVATKAPDELRNVAVWGYWRNAEWAENIGVGGTRVQVRSLPYGWIWFIPVGPDRTSIGLIVHADYYKQAGLSKEDLYHKAVREQPLVEELIRSAEFEGEVSATRDWSFNAERLVGDNWFLIGESAGFADPILAAGMLNGQRSAQDCAATINELEIGELDRDWLLTRFDRKHRENIDQYIRFAQFWYAANGRFTDLKEQCAKIAKEGGINLTPNQAWRWLSQGGFALDDPLKPSVGSYDVFSARNTVTTFLGGEGKCAIETHNVFKLNTYGAEEDTIGYIRNGRIAPVKCLRKGRNTLPLEGYFGTMVQLLQRTDDLNPIINTIHRQTRGEAKADADRILQHYLSTLEAMIQDGWVVAKTDRKRGFFKMPERPAMTPA